MLPLRTGGRLQIRTEETTKRERIAHDGQQQQEEQEQKQDREYDQQKEDDTLAFLAQ